MLWILKLYEYPYDFLIYQTLKCFLEGFLVSSLNLTCVIPLSFNTLPNLGVTFTVVFILIQPLLSYDSPVDYICEYRVIN